jgi:radical SAM superfamily enzyme YgiQ (UPF0313 family)
VKITFIQPYYHNVWEALGLGYIISFLKNNYRGHLDISFFQGYFDKNFDIMNGARNSDIIFFSCTSPSYAHGLRLAQWFKGYNKDIHIVFGGWHPTAVPEEVIKEGCIDQVVVGEGEVACVRIVEGERTPIIRGFSIHPNELNWPDRMAIRNDRTIDLCESINGKRTASFQLNRGCKVHCKYCAEIKMTGQYNSVKNPVRTRLIGDVLDEIDTVTHLYDLDYFKFVDATFDKDRETVIAFCETKRAIGNKTPWECNIHPGFIQDERVFELLAESNCNQINVGCESGSQHILNDIGKGTKVEHIENVFDWAKKYGIERRAYFLLGMPKEIFEDHKKTEQLIDRIEPDHVGFTILCPYPGSDFYNPKTMQKINWSTTDEYSNDFWRNIFYSNTQLKELQKYFTHKYKDSLCERQNIL